MYRQARPQEEIRQEREWEAWERQRRRELLATYARSAVSIVGLICGTVFLIWLILAVINEAM